MFSKGSFIIYITGLLILIYSCSGYEKLLKSKDHKLKYTKAFEYYNKGDYVKAQTLLEQLIPIYGGIKQADSVSFFYAMTFYKLQDYILAGHHFKTFATVYGNSPMAEEADFLNAYCFYLNSPRPELDQESSYQAIDAMQLFMIKYPNSTRIDDCKKYIAELRNKLVEKSFISARLYYDLSNYKAAIIALNSSLSKYPETKYREEILFLILKSSYLLAENSVAEKRLERYQSTLDEYYSFIDEFPQSKYKKEAERIFENAGKILKISDTASYNNN